MLIGHSNPIIIPVRVYVLHGIDHRLSGLRCADCHSLGVIQSFPVDLQCIQNRGNYRHSWCLTYILFNKAVNISLYMSNSTSHAYLCIAPISIAYHCFMKEEWFVQFMHFGCLVPSVPTILMPTSTVMDKNNAHPWFFTKFALFQQDGR